ncbi:hypothetical protein [Paenibacillus piri]|uniref:Uncharacterized protein n=1 Tax=Paenibacillus piri TaxID=2547395 RepID=A0A4R5KLV5_9BACL|nr:hypothetical protein [Paenibacillus piri]TDF95895.1 hypothetical protein E1757_19425 [Paenibacillus piri]
MKLILAVAGGMIGLMVTASAIYLAWTVFPYIKSRTNKEAAGGSLAERDFLCSQTTAAMMKWTYFDYALIGVFGIGSLFLFTDVVAVIRDSDSYPLYHYGYLLCGFVFTLFGMMFMVLRFTLVLRLVRPDRTAALPDNHYEPSGAEQAD